MSDRRVRDDIREYYLAQRLSPATLQRLRTMETAGGLYRPSRMRSSSRALLSAAAVALCAAGLWIVFGDRGTDAATEAIVGEIAMNHNKRLDVEFETASFTELRRVMDKLDFSLIEPSRTREQGLRLVGARYCSIRGQLAAQLSLEAADGKHLTLYQAASPADLESLEWTRLRSGGLTIDLWREGGILLGMARGP